MTTSQATFSGDSMFPMTSTGRCSMYHNPSLNKRTIIYQKPSFNLSKLNKVLIVFRQKFMYFKDFKRLWLGNKKTKKKNVPMKSTHALESWI